MVHHARQIEAELRELVHYDLKSLRHLRRVGVHSGQRIVELAGLLLKVGDLLARLLLNPQQVLLLRFGVRVESLHFLTELLKSHDGGLLQRLGMRLDLTETGVNVGEVALSGCRTTNTSRGRPCLTWSC